MPPEPENIIDFEGRRIRVSSERWQHILDHPEMHDQQDRLNETLSNPDIVISTAKDELIHIYHKRYDKTPVTRKYLVIVVKLSEIDGFIVTAYFTSQLKRGSVLWQK